MQANGAVQFEFGPVGQWGKRRITVRKGSETIIDECNPLRVDDRGGILTRAAEQFKLDHTALKAFEYSLVEAADKADGEGSQQLPSVLRVSEFMAKYPEKRKPVIQGLLRRGETMNMIAATKVGKSWLAAALALSASSGGQWLGRSVSAGDVLLIDNELHPETLSDRLETVIRAMQLTEYQYDGLMPFPLRGNWLDIVGLGKVFDQFKPGQLSMVVIDALYRAMPSGAKENDNDSFRGFYNLVDRYAAKLDCAFVLIHHSSKGNQADKGVTDVGAGGGAMSRAADTHLVVREHDESGVAVVDAACRSFPPNEPFCMRWEYPLWHLDEETDPTEIKRDKGRRANKEREHEQLVAKYEENIIKALVSMPDNQGSESAIKKHSGNGGRAFSEALACLLRTKQVEMFQMKHPGNGRPIDAYKLSENTF